MILSGGESLHRSRARARHVPGDRGAARQVRGAGRRQGRRADDRRHPDRRASSTICMRRGVWMISVASVDDFHVGLEGPAKQKAFMDKLSALFERHGMRRSRPVGDHAQLARGSRARVQLLRRDARLVDRQAVAARPRVAERPVAGDARGQFLQSLVGRPQLPAPSMQRLGGVGRARRRRVSVLHQDQAADRQPARGQPDRHPRFARRRARLRGDHDGPSRAHGPRARLERGGVHRAIAHDARRTGAVPEPVHRLRPLPRAGAGPGARGRARARRRAANGIAEPPSRRARSSPSIPQG